MKNFGIMLKALLLGTGVHMGPHDFGIAAEVQEPESRPKKLGLIHEPKVRTIYPPNDNGHHYPAPPPCEDIFKALTILQKEVDHKLRGKKHTKAKPEVRKELKLLAEHNWVG